VHALDYPQTSNLFNEGAIVPFEGNPVGLAFTTRQTIVRNRIDESEFPASEVMEQARREGTKAGVSIPLISCDRVLGMLGIVNQREDSFSEDDVELLTQIANQIAIAVENALNFEGVNKAKQQLKHERDRSQLLLEINNAVASH